MKPYILPSILISVLLAGCSDKSADYPAMTNDGPVTISYATSGYAGSRASGEATDHGWDEFNENHVYSLDLFLVKDDKVTLYWSKVYPDNTPNSTDCDTRHTFISDDPELSHERISNADYIYLVANSPQRFTVDPDETPLLKDVLSIDLTGLNAREKQDRFVMTGEVKLTDEMKKVAYNINIPLERVAAKIKINLLDKEKSPITAEQFTSVIQHNATGATLSHRYDTSNYYWNNTRLACKDNIPSGFIDNNDWESLTDITEPHPSEMTREGGHVYYTYPTDWYNLTANYIEKGCKRTSHKDAAHTDKDGVVRTERVTIRDYDKSEPIIAGRQVYAIVQAPFKGKTYFYKVPVNKRLYKYNDQQCFSEHVLFNDILPLYRADRNHFYDVTAIIDRQGASTPSEAASNPYFIATIADMTDGGTFDYIYD